MNQRRGESGKQKLTAAGAGSASTTDTNLNLQKEKELINSFSVLEYSGLKSS